MDTWILYTGAVTLLLVSAFGVFRILVRQDYQKLGRLSSLAGWLELVIFLAFVLVPFIYNPACWAFFWACQPQAAPPWAWIGYGFLGLGALLGFGAMIWLGLMRSFGQQVSGLIQSGPYRFTRNPQVFGGTLMVAGVALLWPSGYALGWVFLWMAMFHMMVLSEEEYLLRQYGDEYRTYCQQVPRYLKVPGLK